MSQARRRVIPPSSFLPGGSTKGDAPASPVPPGGSLSPLGLGPRSHASPQGLTLAGEVNSWVRVTRRVADSPARRGHFGGSPGPLHRASRLSSASNAPGFPSRSGRLSFPTPRLPPTQGSGERRERCRRGGSTPPPGLHAQQTPRPGESTPCPTFSNTPLGPSRKRFTLHEARSRLSWGQEALHLRSSAWRSNQGPSVPWHAPPLP